MATENILLGKLDPSCGATPRINSNGIWNLKDGESILNYTLPLLELQIAVMFLLTYILHFFLQFLGFPRIVSEILAGMVLGQGNAYVENLFPRKYESLIVNLSKTGYLLFMFLVGVKIDISIIKKSVKQVWTMAFLSVIFPLSLAMYASWSFTADMSGGVKEAYQIVSISQSLTPFPVIALLLTDLKILNSELGRLALSSALISDLLCSFVLAAINYIHAVRDSSVQTGLQSFALSTLFIMLVVFVMRPWMLWIIKQTPEGKPVDEIYTMLIVVAAFGSAIICELVGLQHLFGPFILGLAVPDGPPLGSALVHRLDTLVSGLIVPLFMTYCGYKTALTGLVDSRIIVFFWIIVFVTFVGKISATLFPALYCKMPVKDATALAVIMSAKGVVDMGRVFGYAENKTIEDDLFAAVSGTVLVVAATMPYIVRFLYDPSRKYAGYQKRNILHSADNTELRIVACIYKQDEAYAAVKLLEASNATKESPISVYALHLVELTGRSTPLLINHGLGQKVSSSRGSMSQHIIDVFNFHRNQNPGLVDVHVFTAISLPKFMHDDICSLAFDKTASLIVLPFHRKWDVNGNMVSDNRMLRSINTYVMDNAPCSVGILMDRCKIRGPASILTASPSCRVAVLFLGGEDDREALAYAKRMARCPRIRLTVIRFTTQDDYDPVNDRSNGGWDFVIDSELLKDLRNGYSQHRNISYREEMVRDGADTASIIRSAEQKYDLIMVGRRHRADSPLTQGLTEWNELPEIGTVADLLASSDFRGSASILVVQQQVQQK